MIPFKKLDRVRLLDIRRASVQLKWPHLVDICGLISLTHLLGFGIKQQFRIREESNIVHELPKEIGDLYQLKTLDISYDGYLRKLHREVGSMEQLEYLNIRNTEITELPKEIGMLRELEILDISNTPIKQLPKEIGALQQLKTLIMTDTKFNELSREIGDLHQLKALDIRKNNYLTELPREIGSLQQLEYLNMSNTRIRELPKEIGGLQQLKTLIMTDTEFNELPREIGNLHQLKTLDLSSSRRLRKLPTEIGSLQQLEYLKISHLQIRELPKEIGGLQQLRTLDMSDLCDMKLPREIGKLQHLEKLLLSGTYVQNIPRAIGALKKLKILKLDRDSIVSVPLEVSLISELTALNECLHQACRKSDVVSSLAGKLLSFQTNPMGDGGSLVIGANLMHVPRWITDHFNDLGMLDISICKLDEQGLKILREMPKLGYLQLRFEIVPTEPISIRGEGFARLWELRVHSRVPRVTFLEGAMPRLARLCFSFKFYGGPPNKDPVGIKHLQSLDHVSFWCNKDWYRPDRPCISATIKVLRKEAQEHPNRIAFEVTGRKPEYFPDQIDLKITGRKNEYFPANKSAKISEEINEASSSGTEEFEDYSSSEDMMGN